MALLDFKRTDIQRATAERRRAHLEQVVVLFRLYAFITIALAVSAALSAVFIVPLLYTQAQYAQNELQDDVDFCLQRTATLNVRVDMLDGRRVKRNLAKRKRKKPSASDYAEFDRPPGISPAKISSRRIEAHGTQTHNGGPDGEPGLDGRPGRNGRNGVDALPGQQTTEEDFYCPRAPAGFPGVPGLKGPEIPVFPVQGKMGVQGKPGLLTIEGKQSICLGRDGPPGERGRPGKLIIVDGPIGAPGALERR
ncbi:hypothetical protein M3Y98_00884800 [Aphelenchoides besseyi]|nr:hypothetical protein M3Y98_00884800 [Aphelenchoides besseyi]